MSEPYTVQRRGDHYVVKYPDATVKTGYRKRRLASTDRQSAEAEARQLWTGAGDGVWTVGRIMQAYLKDRELEGIASLQRRKDAWKAMRPFWEHVDPDLIDKAMCKKYGDTRPVSDTTVRYELGMLSTALGFANDNERRFIDRKPRIWLPPKPDRKIRHLTVPEYRQFTGAMIMPHAILYCQIGIATMARPSAILELQWSQVNFDRQLIDYNPPGRTQTKKNRPVVPINRTLLAALEKAWEARQSEFVIEVAGGPIKSIKKAFQAASKRSGVYATPYTLRHTGAVWAAEKGIPMSQLAQFMGHDDSRTTEKHYARYSPDYLRGVADAIDIDISPVEPSEARKQA